MEDGRYEIKECLTLSVLSLVLRETLRKRSNWIPFTLLHKDPENGTPKKIKLEAKVTGLAAISPGVTEIKLLSTDKVTYKEICREDDSSKGYLEIAE